MEHEIGDGEADDVADVAKSLVTRSSGVTRGVREGGRTDPGDTIQG